MTMHATPFEDDDFGTDAEEFESVTVSVGPFTEEQLEAMVAEGIVEKYTDEAGEVHYREL